MAVQVWEHSVCPLVNDKYVLPVESSVEETKFQNHVLACPELECPVVHTCRISFRVEALSYKTRRSPGRFCRAIRFPALTTGIPAMLTQGKFGR
jgi:hypothetical protein